MTALCALPENLVTDKDHDDALVLMWSSYGTQKGLVCGQWKKKAAHLQEVVDGLLKRRVHQLLTLRVQQRLLSTQKTHREKKSVSHAAHTRQHFWSQLVSLPTAARRRGDGQQLHGALGGDRQKKRWTLLTFRTISPILSSTLTSGTPPVKDARVKLPRRLIGLICVDRAPSSCSNTDPWINRDQPSVCRKPTCFASDHCDE